MSLDVSKMNSNNANMNAPLLEPGAYPARLVRLIDFGMHEQYYQGESKGIKRILALTYELTDEFMHDEDGNELKDKPRWVNEFFPMHGLDAEKARSTARYKALDPSMKHKGDFGKLLGAPCLVTIVHNPNPKGDRPYENVGGVAPMRDKEAAKLPELVNPTVVFDTEDPDLKIYNGLADWQKEKISNSVDFRGSKLEEMLLSSQVGGTESEDLDETLDGDDIPF